MRFAVLLKKSTFNLCPRPIIKHNVARISVFLIKDLLQRELSNWCDHCYFSSLATERERHLTTGKRAEKTKLHFRCKFAALPLVKPVV